MLDNVYIWNERNTLFVYQPTTAFLIVLLETTKWYFNLMKNTYPELHVQSFFSLFIYYR